MDMVNIWNFILSLIGGHAKLYFELGLTSLGVLWRSQMRKEWKIELFCQFWKFRYLKIFTIIIFSADPKYFVGRSSWVGPATTKNFRLLAQTLIFWGKWTLMGKLLSKTRGIFWFDFEDSLLENRWDYMKAVYIDQKVRHFSTIWHRTHFDTTLNKPAIAVLKMSLNMDHPV